MIIRPAKSIRGRLRMPGDKSISHRAAMIAALAQGTSRLRDFASGDDCAATLRCLTQLGISVRREGQDVLVDSHEKFSPPTADLDCANSGSTLRMLAGVLAGQPFATTLTGDASLRSRPMGRIIEPLMLMGARIDSQNDRAPLLINGSRSLKAISYQLPVASAQVKSCILFAALNTEGRTEVVERIPTRNHTERMLQWFGVPIEIAKVPESAATSIGIEGVANLTARDVAIPGDISSAAFFIAAAALLPDSNLVIDGVGLNPTRMQFVETLRSLHARIEIENEREECNEPRGSMQVRGSLELNPGLRRAPSRQLINGPIVPLLIDELPLLAVIGTQLEGGLEIREAAELRVKETDRIAATALNLRAMGAEVEEFEDGLAVNGPVQLRGATIEPHGDHRIAMAFAVAALIAEGESEIKSAECVDVSFPEFFSLLETVAIRQRIK